jgi:protein involved in sex pheromone biosynthesis
MAKHRSVDHKDSDAEYAAHVRKFVGQHVDAELLPIDDAAFLVGRWRSSLSHAVDQEFDLEHLADGTLRLAGEEPVENAEPDQWQFKDGGYFQKTWVPPMPEYDIDEPSWNYEGYRCAQTADGRIVYWNGDGSLVVTLTRVM